MEGVSHELLQAFLLMRLWVPKFTHQLLGSTTDRKVFYSQCGISYERACTNSVRPTFKLGDFVGARLFTVAGAECDSFPEGVREGLVSVAAPAQKRLWSQPSFRLRALGLRGADFAARRRLGFCIDVQALCHGHRRQAFLPWSI